MGVETLSLLVVGGLIALLAVGTPVGFATGAVAVVLGVSLFGPNSLIFVANRIYELLNNYALLAVPLFVLMGLVMERSGIAEDVFRAMHRRTRMLPGGLAVGTIGASAVMAAMVGVIGAEVVALGLVALPAMLRRGYDRRISLGVICAGGSLGSLIPPSVLLVLFGVVTNVSVSKLFMAAIVPGAIYCLLFAAYVVLLATLRPELAPKESPDELPREHAPLAVLPGLAIIVAMFASLYLGIATPTEVGAVGLALALCVALWRRRFAAADLRGMLRTTSLSIGSVLFVFFGANALVSYYNFAGGTTFLSTLFTDLPVPPVGVILLMMVIWFVLGMFLDFVAILFLTVPIFLPVAQGLGYSPIWFGILFCMNMQMAYLTPPFGPAAFYLKSVAPPDVSIGEIFRANVPFVALQALGLLIVLFWPELALWLPERM